MKQIWLLLVLFFVDQKLLSQDVFTQTFGGKQNEHGIDIVETRDDAYVCVGTTDSYGKGKNDVCVFKIDPLGRTIWRKYMGSSFHDRASDLLETRDGNYVIAGYTKNEENGSNDAWVFSLNRHGELMWSHTYGGNQEDHARALTQTSDGGFLLAGFSESYSSGGRDIWVVRLNAVGEILWQDNYGGKGAEEAYDVIQTRDEGFLIGGYQRYDKAERKADMLLVKIDRNGKGTWRKSFPAKGNDVIEKVIETKSGDYLAAGWAYSPKNKSLDGKLLKVNRGGKLLWQKYYGGKAKDAIYDIEQSDRGDFVMAGQTASYSDSDDVWLMKINEEGELRWQRSSQGKKDDYAHAVAATRDRGFALIGGTKSYGKGGRDLLVFKTDSKGNFKQSTALSSPDLPREDKANAYAEDQSKKPNLYVLAVGVSRYEDQTVSLKYAHTDASAMAEQFARQEGKIFNRVEVRKLMNKRATLVNIRSGINWLESTAGPRDMILMFISAHGALDDKGSLYILPTDFEASNLFATALNIRDLTEGVGGSSSKKMIFLDACHSGQSAYDLLEFANINSFNLNAAVEDMVKRESGLSVMTSSSGEEFSYENPRWGHGAFTKALLEGFGGHADFNEDETVSLGELNLYVMERVKELTSGRQHPYMPINLFGNIPLFRID
ncbi:MAG: caspase family protein [Bacteroidota bacterium]